MSYQDPYLQKRAQKEAQIAKQIKAQLNIAPPDLSPGQDAIGEGIMQGFFEKPITPPPDPLAHEHEFGQAASGLWLPASVHTGAHDVGYLHGLGIGQFIEPSETDPDHYLTLSEMAQSTNYASAHADIKSFMGDGASTFTTVSGAQGVSFDKDSVLKAVRMAKKAIEEASDHRRPPTLAEYELTHKINRRLLRNAKHEGLHFIRHCQLRHYHGREDEYVYSPTLNCHVRIGESLKLK